MTKPGKDNGRLRIFFIVLMVLTVISFFVHSLMPPDASQSESDGVAEIISGIIPTDTAIGAFIVNNIRKLAHFCEYGLLGTEMSVYIISFVPEKKRKRSVIYSPILAQLVAFSDESLQIISGRGPSITDVWIDVFGFIFFSALVYFSVFAFSKLRKLCRAKHKED